VPAGCAELTDHAPAVKTRLYVPAARLAVPTVQVRVSSPAAVHPEAALPATKDRAQVEVVAGDPPVKVAAVAVLNHPPVKLNTTLPLVIGRAVAVVNARVKVPVVVAPGTMSAATEAAAVPLPLALPPAVIAGTEPEPAVSMTTPVEVAVATL